MPEFGSSATNQGTVAQTGQNFILSHIKLHRWAVWAWCSGSPPPTCRGPEPSGPVSSAPLGLDEGIVWRKG